MAPQQKVLEIGNYPPPMCGWAMQTFLLVDEMRRRGHKCEVLKINEGRQQKGSEYVDVQNGIDYVLKVLRFALRGYRLHAHVNGSSKKGYLLALFAVLVGRLFSRPAALSFHGGIPQPYFPNPNSKAVRLAFHVLFWLAGSIVCDSDEIKEAISSYGMDKRKVEGIPCFSAQCLAFRHTTLSPEIESFLVSRWPVFFSYLSFRSEYRLEVLRHAISIFCERHPGAGFIWLGFPAKEMPAAQAYLRSWDGDEAARVLLLTNLTHDDFLTLLSRCYAMVRTPACDGVSASVLESLALGIPVLASENGRRPPGVITYREDDPFDLASNLEHLCANYADVKEQTCLETRDDNLGRTVDWLLGERSSGMRTEAMHAD